jgi:hypothetical protein
MQPARPNRMGVVIPTALSLVFLSLLYLSYTRHEMPALQRVALAGLSGNIGMLCFNLRTFVSQVWLRRSLTVMVWGLITCSLLASLSVFFGDTNFHVSFARR